MKTFALLGALALGVASIAQPAQAEGHSHTFRDNSTYFDFGDKERWILRARAVMVEPNEGSNTSLIGGSVDIDEQFVPEIDFTYFFTKNVAAELILATTPHDVTATGTTLGNVDLGDVWLLPPTLTFQYHFMPENEGFRPYIGAGFNYTYFYNEDKGAVDGIDYDSSFGYALQAGFDYGLNEHWALNVDVKRVDINTDVTVISGANRINADVDIDPWIIGVGLAYRF